MPKITAQKNIKSKVKNGMALVEVIAALGISMVVITSLVSLSIYALRTSLESKLLLQGTKLANREIELVRAYRDGKATWTDFLTGVKGCVAASPCHIETPGSSLSVVTGVYPEGTGTEIVNRSFTATRPDGNPLSNNPSTDKVARITTTASWKIGGGTKQTNLYTDLTNWRTPNN